MFLVTRPNYDYTTRYISCWAEKLIEWVKSRGVKVLDLPNHRATKEEVESMVRKHSPRVIFINGHGNHDCVTGQDSNVLIKAGENEHLLSGTITYALSCSSSKVLGPSAVHAGCLAYIGYKEDFIFMYDTEKRSKPYEDKTAILFLEPSNQVIMSLMKGHSVKDSVISAKRMFVKNVQNLLTSASPQQDTSAVRYLLWDMQHLTFDGNSDSKIN